nr:hypothetical protein [Novosphingobium resinovorum]
MGSKGEAGIGERRRVQRIEEQDDGEGRCDGDGNRDWAERGETMDRDPADYRDEMAGNDSARAALTDLRCRRDKDGARNERREKKGAPRQGLTGPHRRSYDGGAGGTDQHGAGPGTARHREMVNRDAKAPRLG